MGRQQSLSLIPTVSLMGLRAFRPPAAERGLRTEKEEWVLASGPGVKSNHAKMVFTVPGGV